jgi:hyperosmotically inducible periplasmic protein
MRADRAAIAPLAFLLAATVVAGACGKAIGETIDDATISTRVKTALLNDPDIDALTITVDTTKGVVTLSGRIKTAAEEQRAIELARKTPGVQDVKSVLRIGDEAVAGCPLPVAETTCS